MLLHKIYKTVAALLLCLPFELVAQHDSIVSLNCNPALVEAGAHRTATQTSRSHGKKAVLNLPFFEDFTGPDKFPSGALWENIYVFVNRSMAVNPPSVGVATFDGLNQYGKAYTPGDVSNTGKPSDTLTSQPIDLSLYSEADSIYLSFFWQPQGFGAKPESTDSLVLQFKVKGDPDRWRRVWSAYGRSSQPFRQAMIKLKLDTNNNYFTDSFQFRFVNYAKHSGNLDHWHVDYIFMDRNRNINDSIYEDVAIYYPPASLSKHYYSMPWKHFVNDLNNQLTSEIGVYATNNSDKVKNVTYGYSITDVSTGNEITNTFNQQSDNLDPNVHKKFPLQAKFDANLPPSGNDKVKLLVKTAVKNVPDDFPHNDTSFHYQVFDSYLAHDDGTAEYGYRLVGTYNTGKVAVPFEINRSDTLFGVLIFFTPLESDVTNEQFTVAAWNNKDNDPIATLDFARPSYDAGVGEFTYFEFANPVIVEKQFHVGWIQPKFNIDVGLDSSYWHKYNLNSSHNLKYISFGQNGPWKLSPRGGALMIRPVLGQRYVGIHKKAKPVTDFEVNVYPNPASGNVNIQLPVYGSFNVGLMDLTGKEVENIQQVNSIINVDCNNYPQGIYLVRVTNNANGQTVSKKLIVR